MDGFVLAGGASARFGEDKALARVEGRRLVDTVVDALAPLERVCVVRRPGQAPVAGHEVLVGEEGHDRHPLWGVAVALEHATTPRALVVPCDLVALEADHIHAFLAAAGDGEAVAWDGERLHPLLAILTRDRSVAVRTAAAEGQSVRAFMAALPRVLVATAALRNLNRRPGDD